MTIIVGILCTDGVVVGADSSATFGDGQVVATIEQHTDKKIKIVGERVIVAGTGLVGHTQRLVDTVQTLWSNGDLKDLSAIDTGRTIAHHAIEDFGKTIPIPHLKSFPYSAFVAFPTKVGAHLCEFLGGSGFQPELKELDDFWFTSAGSGQAITDPFLALVARVFFKDGPPTTREGIFAAVWALQHACDLNTGGIKEPIHIAVLERDPSKKGQLFARMLAPEELDEHKNIVSDAERYMAEFRDQLEGKVGTSEPPKPKPDPEAT